MAFIAKDVLNRLLKQIADKNRAVSDAEVSRALDIIYADRSCSEDGAGPVDVDENTPPLTGGGDGEVSPPSPPPAGPKAQPFDLGSNNVAAVEAALSAMEEGGSKKLATFQGTRIEARKNISPWRWMEYSGLRYYKGRLYGVGGGHATTFNDTVNVYDLETDQWAEDYPPTACVNMVRGNYDPLTRGWIVPGQLPRPSSSHSYDLIHIVNGKLINMSLRGKQSGGCAPADIGKWSATDSRVAIYDLQSKSWIYRTALSGENMRGVTSWGANSPGSAVANGKIYIFGRTGLQSYNPVTDVKQLLNARGNFNGYETTLLCSDEDAGTFYAMSRIYNTRQMQLVKITNFGKQINILAMVDVGYNENKSSQTWGWFWDEENQVIARIFEGHYEWISPHNLLHGDHTLSPSDGRYRFSAQVQGREKIDSLGPNHSAFFYCTAKVGRTLLYTIKGGDLYALGLPTVDTNKLQGAPRKKQFLEFGNIDALISRGYIVDYTDRRINVDLNQEQLNVSHDTGSRGEIGYNTAWTMKAIATRDQRLLDLIVTQANQNEPWDDYDKMINPHGEYQLSFAHTPDLFFTPWLLTGSDETVDRMELLWTHYCRWKARPITAGIDSITGRELAWQLRLLSQLTLVQRLGYTKGTFYEMALAETLERATDIINNPSELEATWNIWEFGEGTKATYGFSGWMQSFVGIVTNRMVESGHFGDWYPVINWHYQHLAKRSGGEWPEKALGMDHAKFRRPDGTLIQPLNWETVTPYQGAEQTFYEAWPSDQLLPIGTKEAPKITYSTRAYLAWEWAAIAANNGIDGAAELRDRIAELIRVRGKDHRFQ